MEVSVISSSQVNLGRINDIRFCSLSRNFNPKFCNAKNNNYHSKGCSLVQSQSFIWPSRSAAIGLSLRASASPQSQAVVSEKASKITRTKPNNGLKLYVGLPLDTISNSNTINNARAIATGLKALKLLGVDGIELPLYWGIAEKEAMGKYDWTGYLAIVEMVQNLGLKLHISLCFHASKEAKISLPEWVSQIGNSNPDIYFTDRSGRQYMDCLSLAVDDLPVLDGKTPLEVYGDFFESFKSSFSPFMGSTITGLTIGLGPDGELRYPSHHQPTKGDTHPSAGEFQCYDKHTLSDLKNHAERHGNPLWGLGGPHDTPEYDQSPILKGFFAENGGSWETPYGDFFLSWYSSRLTRHADRVLSLATSAFDDSPLFGKIPLMHAWSGVRSHPSELTAGFYNTDGRDGYNAIAEIFSRNSCGIVIPALDLLGGAQSRPEALITQIASSCEKYGVGLLGEYSSVVSGDSGGFERIGRNLLGGNLGVDLFMYQRMGAYFFSPEHFPSFTRFVRGLSEPGWSLDDVAVECEGAVESVSGEKNLQMQTA